MRPVKVMPYYWAGPVGPAQYCFDLNALAQTMSWHVESLNVADINKTDLQLHRRAAVSAGIFQGNLPTLEFLLQVKKIHSLIVYLHSFLIMAQSWLHSVPIMAIPIQSGWESHCGNARKSQRVIDT